MNSQDVLVDLTVFHDDGQIPFGVFDHANVFKRIAVQDQQIRERTFLYDAERAGIGSAEI